MSKQCNHGFVLPGESGNEAFVDGWYGLERSPEGILFQASGRRATLKLPGARGTVEFSLLLSARPEHAKQPLRFMLRANSGTSPLSWTLETNGWMIRGGVIDAGVEGIVQLEALNPWSPDALYNNGDARLLGVLLAAVRWRKLKPRT